MKNRLSSALMVLAMLWGTASATGFDGSQPLLCASATVIECLPTEGCRLVAAEAIAAPDFMRLDLAAKTVTSSGAAGSGKSSVIERSDLVDSKLILQGAEDGIEGVRDGVGWTIAIAQDTGKMVLTASGDNVAFTIFGTCTTL
jgi:hypothetical protein